MKIKGYEMKNLSKVLLGILMCSTLSYAEHSAYERALMELKHEIAEQDKARAISVVITDDDMGKNLKVKSNNILDSKDTKELKRRIIDEKLSLFLDAESIEQIKELSKFTRYIKKIDKNNLYVQHSWTF